MIQNSYKSFPTLNINGEEAVIDEIYIAPLGHLMIKFYLEKNKTWTTYNVGRWKEVILPLIEEKISGEIIDYLEEFETINKSV